MANRHRRLWPRTNGFGLFLIYTRNRYAGIDTTVQSKQLRRYYSVMVSRERIRRTKTKLTDFTANYSQRRL